MDATTASADVCGSRAFLVDALRVDALASGAMGVLLAAGGAWLDGVLDAPATFVVPLGAFLVVYALGLLAVTRAGAPAAAVKAVIVGNVVWIVASVAAVVFDWLTLSGLGTVFVLLQAAAVAVFAELQLVGLRRAR